MDRIGSDRQRRAIRHGDALFRFEDGKRATHTSFNAKNIAIFIHGFTANADYMGDLMHQFNGAGFVSFAFEYASFKGIDHAAKSLSQLLTLLDNDGTISRNRVVLVGHSMGGLVARAFISLENGARFARKVITLGTPHDGTLKSSWLVKCLANLGESLSGLNPEGYTESNRSTQQLIGADGPPALLEQLKKCPPSEQVDFYSISGGYGRLEFGPSWSKNLLANLWLQSKLDAPNDGLVSDESSDLSRKLFSACAPGAAHLNNYPEYSDTNHTYLVNNQTVALLAIQCAA